MATTSIETFQSVTTTTKTTKTSSSRVVGAKKGKDKTHLKQQQQHEAAETILGSVKEKAKIPSSVSLTLDDVDDLIARLSKEEIEELAKVDPDDVHLPAHLRCLYHCDKSSTGKLNRKSVLANLRDAASNTPDKEDAVKYVPGVIRGKKFVAKRVRSSPLPASPSYQEQEEEKKPALDFQLSQEETEEYDKFFANASLEDLKDVADILGIIYQDHCHATELKLYPTQGLNVSDVDAVIQQVEENNLTLEDVNFNNIKNISRQQFRRLFSALHSNEHVSSVSLANCGLTDDLARSGLAAALEANNNSGLRTLNVESNLLSPDAVLVLLRAIAKGSNNLEELRVANQLNSKYLGYRVENEIADLLRSTPKLVRLGINMEFRDTLNRTAVQLQKNLDKATRLKRRAETLEMRDT